MLPRRVVARKHLGTAKYIVRALEAQAILTAQSPHPMTVGQCVSCSAHVHTAGSLVFVAGLYSALEAWDASINKTDDATF